jgi:hypothetical protein
LKNILLVASFALQESELNGVFSSAGELIEERA